MIPCALLDLAIASANSGALRTANIVAALVLFVSMNAFVTVLMVYMLVANWILRNPFFLLLIALTNNAMDGAIARFLKEHPHLSAAPILDFVMSIPDSAENTWLNATANAYDFLKAYREARMCPSE